MVGLTPLIAVFALAGVSSATAPLSHRIFSKHWLSSWATMPQLTEPANLPPAPFTATGAVLVNATVRQSFKISRSGSRFRLRFSNAFSDVPLDLTTVTVALPANRSAVGTSAIDPKTLHTVTFSGGAKGFSVPNGAQVVSDPIDWAIPENTIISVSTYLANGQRSGSNSVTSHPGSRTTSYFDFGDLTTAANLTGATRGQADHWYFLSGVEVETADPLSYAIAIVGDSITDGRGSTVNGNDRLVFASRLPLITNPLSHSSFLLCSWPDQFYERLRARPSNHVSYLNQAAGGNRILADGLGPNALGRIDRDVLAQTRVGAVILFEGVNDIGTAAPDAASQAAVAARVISAMKQIVTRVQAQEKSIYGATITPFGGNSYDVGDRETARQTVNKWIREGGAFDGVIDFDKTVRDPTNTTRLLPAYDVGDGLHLNPAGYKAMAGSVPLAWFP
jgi:lysophospholipase L1-like esterase